MTYEFNEFIGQSMTTYEKPSKNQSEHDIYGILSWISENYPILGEIHNMGSVRIRQWHKS